MLDSESSIPFLTALYFWLSWKLSMWKMARSYSHINNGSHRFLIRPLQFQNLTFYRMWRFCGRRLHHYFLTWLTCCYWRITIHLTWGGSVRNSHWRKTLLFWLLLLGRYPRYFENSRYLMLHPFLNKMLHPFLNNWYLCVKLLKRDQYSVNILKLYWIWPFYVVPEYRSVNWVMEKCKINSQITTSYRITFDYNILY